ncbi:MAG: PDZ domain-containing protein, partial [Verrucomicrobiales bacterium]
GRYGSWDHQHDSQNRATSTLRQALEGVLKLHDGYPGNRESLAGKTGDPMAYRSPIDMPELRKFGPELDWEGKVVGSCVHCHQIGDAIRQEIRAQGKPMPMSWLYPYPSPETLGITLGEEPVTGVTAVAEGSVAAAAGLKVGDEILALDGQALVSAADVSWVLHRFPESGSLKVLFRRGPGLNQNSLDLPEGWRAGSANPRRAGYWPMRAMAFGGMKLEPLDEEAKKALGIAPDKLALHLLHVGEYGKHAAAKRAGFRKEDVIVEVAGSDTPVTEIELLAKNILEKKPGENVPVIVLRGGKRIPLEMPVQ